MDFHEQAPSLPKSRTPALVSRSVTRCTQPNEARLWQFEMGAIGLHSALKIAEKDPQEQGDCSSSPACWVLAGSTTAKYWANDQTAKHDLLTKINFVVLGVLNFLFGHIQPFIQMREGGWGRGGAEVGLRLACSNKQPQQRPQITHKNRKRPR